MLSSKVVGPVRCSFLVGCGSVVQLSSILRMLCSECMFVYRVGKSFLVSGPLTSGVGA